MEVLAVTIMLGSAIAAMVVNAEVQRRLMAQGGRWLPSTIKSGLSGFAVMIGINVAYFGIVSIILRATD